MGVVGIPSKRCSECGKEFTHIYTGYLYKVKKKGKIVYQCSYACWKKAGGDSGDGSRKDE